MLDTGKKRLGQKGTGGGLQGKATKIPNPVQMGTKWGLPSRLNHARGGKDIKEASMWRGPYPQSKHIKKKKSTIRERTARKKKTEKSRSIGVLETSADVTRSNKTGAKNNETQSREGEDAKFRGKIDKKKTWTLGKKKKKIGWERETGACAEFQTKSIENEAMGMPSSKLTTGPTKGQHAFNEVFRVQFTFTDQRNGKRLSWWTSEKSAEELLCQVLVEKNLSNKQELRQTETYRLFTKRSRNIWLRTLKNQGNSGSP